MKYWVDKKATDIPIKISPLMSFFNTHNLISKLSYDDRHNRSQDKVLSPDIRHLAIGIRSVLATKPYESHRGMRKYISGFYES
jgi:hypothetical protein